MKLYKNSRGRSPILFTMFLAFLALVASISITCFIYGITYFAIKTKEGFKKERNNELIIQQNKTNEILLRIEERLGDEKNI